MPNRRIEDLYYFLQEKYYLLEQLAREVGIEITMTSGKRSLDEQKAYYFQGRKKLKEVNAQRKKAGLADIKNEENVKVTNTMFSAHLVGQAFDIAVKVNGKVSYEDSSIPLYIKVGEIGELIGLRWGGRFKNPDYPHFEYIEIGEKK